MIRDRSPHVRRSKSVTVTVSGFFLTCERSAPATDNTQWGLGQRATFYSCLRYTTSNPGYDGTYPLSYMKAFFHSYCKAMGSLTRIARPV